MWGMLAAPSAVHCAQVLLSYTFSAWGTKRWSRGWLAILGPKWPPAQLFLTYLDILSWFTSMNRSIKDFEYFFHLTVNLNRFIWTCTSFRYLLDAKCKATFKVFKLLLHVSACWQFETYTLKEKERKHLFFLSEFLCGVRLRPAWHIVHSTAPYCSVSEYWIVILNTEYAIFLSFL